MCAAIAAAELARCGGANVTGYVEGGNVQYGHAGGTVRLCDSRCEVHNARVVYMNPAGGTVAIDMWTSDGTFGSYTLLPGRYTAVATASDLAGRTRFVVRPGRTTHISVTLGRTRSSPAAPGGA